ncbi:MAG: ATP phosphoribosyltransferase regulatory subunit [Firmicutes bacterium]|nr:ATP phosphoribosyltransferase regulatory subunit [Bacillota bacterium]
MTDRQELLHTPEGVWDHYGKDYMEYTRTAHQVKLAFHAYGYEDIKTPTFEFFDVFSREVGTTPSRELYKFFDREGNTLVLRPDFTPSVARCAAKYFRESSEPLRFCYEGSAFQNTANLQGKLHESTELGAELIGDGTAAGDAEVIAMLIDGILKTGLTKFQISVGNVEYFKGICEAAGLDADTERDLRDALSGKNYFKVQDLLKDRNVAEIYRDQIMRITGFMRDGKDLEEAREKTSSRRAQAALERLLDLDRLLEDYGFEKYVSYDLSLLSRYQYYTGILFKGYTYGVGEPIASGGRYDGLLAHFGKDAPAVGFMIPLDTMVEALRAQHIPIKVPEGPTVLTYTEEDFAKVLQKAKSLRAEGARVVMTRAKTEDAG